MYLDEILGLIGLCYNPSNVTFIRSSSLSQPLPVTKGGNYIPSCLSFLLSYLVYDTMGHASLNVLPPSTIVYPVPHVPSHIEKEIEEKDVFSLEMNPWWGTLAVRYRGRRAGRVLSHCSYYYLHCEFLHTCSATDSAAAVSFDYHLQVCGRQR